jgi:hypothetical protein
VEITTVIAAAPNRRPGVVTVPGTGEAR